MIKWPSDARVFAVAPVMKLIRAIDESCRKSFVVVLSGVSISSPGRINRIPRIYRPNDYLMVMPCLDIQIELHMADRRYQDCLYGFRDPTSGNEKSATNIVRIDIFIGKLPGKSTPSPVEHGPQVLHAQASHL